MCVCVCVCVLAEVCLDCFVLCFEVGYVLQFGETAHKSIYIYIYERERESITMSKHVLVLKTFTPNFRPIGAFSRPARSV